MARNGFQWDGALMEFCVTVILLFIHFLDFLKKHFSKEKNCEVGRDTTICLALLETLIILKLEPHRKTPPDILCPQSDSPKPLPSMANR